MSDTLGWVSFIGIWVVVIALLVVRRRGGARRANRLAELALQKGWQLDPRPQRGAEALIRGRESEVDWELRYATEMLGGDSGQDTATFRTEAVAFPGTVLAYPKSAQMQINPRMGKLGEPSGITGKLFNWGMKMIGLDLSNSSFQEVGTRAFLDKYLLLAPDTESARRLVGAVERDLLNWPPVRSPANLPVVFVNPDGVTVRVLREGTSPDYQLQIAEPMVRLGVAAVHAFR